MFERCEPSFSESWSEAEASSSVSGFGRFFDGADLTFVFNVDCDSFLGAAFGAFSVALGAFFAVALGATAVLCFAFG